MNKKRKWVSALAAVLLVLNVFAPSTWSFAEGTEYTVETAIAKGILPSDASKPSFKLMQNGSEIAPEGSINVNEILDIVIDDLNIKLYDIASDVHLIEPGDSLKIYFDNNLKLKEEISASKKIGDVATVTYGEDSHGIYALITFTAAADVLQSTGEVDTSISTSMEIADDALGEITLWGNKYTKIKLPPAREYVGAKSGIVDISTQTVTWTVEVSAKRKSDGTATSLAGATFSDVLDLNTVGLYKNNSFAVKLSTETDAKAITPEYSSNTLSYTFPMDTEATSALITFVTEIPDSKFFTHNESGQNYNGQNIYSDVIISNTAHIFEDSEQKATIYGEAKFKPVWISKYGDSNTNGFDLGSSTVLHITWYITVNQENITMTNAKVTEKWPDKLTFIKSVIQEKVAGEWTDVVGTESTIFTGVFDLGSIDTERRIKILAKGPDSSAQAVYTNTAELTFAENESEPISSTDVAHAGINILSKRPNQSINDKNALEWKEDGLYGNWEVLVHSAEDKLNSNGNNKVFDIFYYEHSVTGSEKSMKKQALDLTDSSLTFDPELPSELKGRTERLKGLSTQDYQAIGQKLIEDNYSYFSNSSSVNVNYLTPKVYKIYRNGIEIGQILEVSGFKSINEWQGIRFQTKIVDPSLLFPNERVEYNEKKEPVSNEKVIVRNTAILLDNDVQINYSSNRHNNDNTTLYKEAIPYKDVQAGDYQNKHAADKNAAQASAFNPQDGTVTFRLSVNGSGRNISGATVWNGTGLVQLGKISVVDYLPKGWQLALMEDNAQFHLYQGEIATSNPNITNPMHIQALGKISTPENYVTLATTTSFGEPKLSFEFANLNAPYVIIFKAKPSLEIMQDYLNKVATNNEGYNQYSIDKIAIDTNNVSMESANWPVEKIIKDKQNVQVPRDVLNKTFVKKSEDSSITWTIEYKGRNAEQLKSIESVVLKDKLSTAIELPINDKKQIDPSAIAIAEHILSVDGKFINPGTLLSSEEKMKYVKYDSETRILTFTVPNASKNYSFSYNTVILDAKDVVNSVEFVNNHGSTPAPVQATVKISGTDINATIKKLGAIYVEKKGKESATATETAPLLDVEFGVYTTDGKLFRTVTTDAEGKAFLGWYMPGTYILKEKKVDGYDAIADMTIVLSKAADGKVVVKQGETEISKDKPLEVINIKSSSNNGGGNNGGNNNNNNNNSNNNNSNSGGGPSTPTSPEVITDPSTPKSDGSSSASDPASEVISDANVPKSDANINGANKNPNSKNANTKIAGAPKTGLSSLSMARELVMVATSGLVALLVADEVLASRRKKSKR